LREEFDHVYANEAEALIADMVFGPKVEDDVEKVKQWYELKMEVLMNYNRKIDVREQRKKFVLERGLLDFQRIQDIRKRMSTIFPSRENITADLEGLSKCMTVQEQEQFEKGILRERASRNEIRKLQQYRSMGIRTFD